MALHLQASLDLPLSNTTTLYGLVGESRQFGNVLSVRFGSFAAFQYVLSPTIALGSTAAVQANSSAVAIQRPWPQPHYKTSAHLLIRLFWYKSLTWNAEPSRHLLNSGPILLAMPASPHPK